MVNAMNLQFNCPFCQQLMTTPPGFAGGQVQCPVCHQFFMVGAVAPVMPVVQAQVVMPVQPAVAASLPPVSAQAPQRAPAPRSAAPRAPGVPTSRSAQPSGVRPPASRVVEEPKSKAGIVLATLVVLLLGGGVWLLNTLNKKAASKDASAILAAASKRTEAAQEQWRKDQAAEKDRVRNGRDSLRLYFAKFFTRGDDKVAEEIVKLILEVDAQHEALCKDADMTNDPDDYVAFFREKLLVMAEKNNIVHHWLGGRSPEILHQALFGRKEEPERGESADFLREGGYRGNGTGFCVSSDGWIITNEHVVDDAASVDVRGADGRIVRADVVKADSDKDIALLRIREKPAAWLTVDPAPLTMGAGVFTIGFPRLTLQGVEPKFIDGRISSLTGFRDEADRYQTTMPVGPGNSGGALVNPKNGTVAGVVVARLNSDNVSYAVKSSELEELIKSASGITAPPPVGDEAAVIERVRQATYLILVK